MSKELDALEKLTNYKCSCMSEKIECKEIIKKALKALEIIKQYLDCSIFIKQLEKHCDAKIIDLLKEVLNYETN